MRINHTLTHENFARWAPHERTRIAHNPPQSRPPEAAQTDTPEETP